MKTLIALIAVVGLVSPSLADSGVAEWVCAFQTRMAFGTRAGALDGVDMYDRIAWAPAYGWTAGGYRVNGQDGLDSDTGFYSFERRAPLVVGQTKTWTIYVWGKPGQTTETFLMDWSCVGLHNDPAVHTSMEYIQKPAGVSGGSDVGTVWTEPPMDIVLPVHTTTDPLTGYAFRFTLTMVAEPSSLLALCAGLVSAGALLRRRRR